MLTDAAPQYKPQSGGTSPTLECSVFAEKPCEREGVGNVLPRPDFWQKNFKIDIKTSFFTSYQKFKKIWKIFLSILKNLIYKNFLQNLTSTLTSPGRIRFKGLYSLQYRVQTSSTRNKRPSSHKNNCKIVTDLYSSFRMIRDFFEAPHRCGRATS